jgi:hypothetical protein
MRRRCTRSRRWGSCRCLANEPLFRGPVTSVFAQRIILCAPADAFTANLSRAV